MGPARRRAVFYFGPLELSLCVIVHLALTAALQLRTTSASCRLDFEGSIRGAGSEITESGSEGLCSQLFDEEGFSCNEHQARRFLGQAASVPSHHCQPE